MGTLDNIHILAQIKYSDNLEPYNALFTYNGKTYKMGVIEITQTHAVGTMPTVEITATLVEDNYIVI